MKRIVITLLTKGAVVYFHNRDLVDLLNRHDFKVTYIGLKRIIQTLNRFSNCDYAEYDLVIDTNGFLMAVVQQIKYIRQLYPASVPTNARRNHLLELRDVTARKFFRYMFSSLAASAGWSAHLALFVEQKILEKALKSKVIDDLAPDVILTGGIGLANASLDGYVSIYGRKKNIRVVSAVINYDGLTAKGLRGCSIGDLIVWGKNMRDDARTLQMVDPKCIHEIGSVRYNLVRMDRGREVFFLSQGLNPEHKTIFFCGSIFPAHYLEVLKAYDELAGEDRAVQLVIRPYPNKAFLESSFVEYLTELISSRPGVHLNHSMPRLVENIDREFLELDEMTYWHFVKYSEAIVSHYSSVSVDSLVCDKSAICLSYYSGDIPFLTEEYVTSLENIYIHHERSKRYNVIQYVKSRRELVDVIKAKLEGDSAPDNLPRMKEEECGPISEDFGDKFMKIIEG